MDTLFFPTTFVSDADLDAMRLCFQKFTVCQPSGLSVPDTLSDLAREGHLDLHVPARIDTEMLKTVLKEYRAWTDLHQSGGRSYLKNFGERAPFFDETTPSKIRADIRRKGGGEPSGQEMDSRFKAAVFLQIAQELDRQNADVGRDLDRVRRKERELFESLRAESAADGTQGRGDRLPSGMDDPGAYMTAERLAAWCRLMSTELLSAGLFVTTSGAVFDYVLDGVEDQTRILTLNTVAVSVGAGDPDEHWRHALKTALEKLSSETFATDLNDITAALPETRRDSGLRLSIRRIAGESPPRFFARFITRNRKTGNGVPPPGKYPHTLVAHLGPGGLPDKV